MAKITVSPTTYNITDANVNIVKIYFTTDVTLTDVKLSIDNGQNFLNNVSMTQTSAEFNISNLENKNYTCLLKGFYKDGSSKILTISNIENITQTANTEFYIQYSTNIAVTKHEVSWDGGSTFYDKTEDIVANGTTYEFKHDNKGNAGTYRMAIRVTTSSGETVTSNIFTLTITSGVSTDTYYSVIYRLPNASSSNSSNSVKKGSSYSTTITSSKGYRIKTINITMDGTDISNSVVSGNNINIPNVTGEIVINVSTEVIEDTGTYYTVKYNLNNASSSNTITSIKRGSSYSTTISPASGYTVTDIYCVMNGINVTNSVVNGNNINIPNVTGEIVINVFTKATGGGGTDTYYTIRYYLHDSTSSNTSTSIKKGSSYSTTITPKNGYKVNSISCMMGGTDISSSTVSGTAVNIPNVTGDVSVLVDTEAISTSETGTIGNMTYGKGINQSTHVITDNTECWATVKAVTVEKGATYTLQMDATWVWGYAFDDSDNYVSELFTSNGNNNYTYTFTAPTTKIRYGCYDPSKALSYCNLTKTSGGSSSGGDSSNTEYTTSCTSAYILDKMYPMPQNHEALPSGVTDTWATQSRWENQQRPTATAHNCGQSGCPGAVAFRALGAWANVYRVKDKGFSANTGVEMRNIKVYGWYNGQWEKVQDMAVPDGNFYAESFSGDSNTYFSDSIKTTSTSKTIILREANKINNENCMYHPFSDIKNFDTKYEYVYTCIDLRKVKWNESGTDDRDSSHYCASCGGDWWLAEGLTFDSSWQHNKGIAQPKIIEITKEWRRFSMTTVPQNWTNGFPSNDESGNETPSTNYTVTYNLNDSTSSNNVTSVEKWSKYSTDITANNNYTIKSINVFIDGDNYGPKYVNNNKIEIPLVTGNIHITVVTETSAETQVSGVFDRYCIMDKNFYITYTTNKPVKEHFVQWGNTGFYDVTKTVKSFGNKHILFYDQTSKHSWETTVYNLEVICKDEKDAYAHSDKFNLTVLNDTNETFTITNNLSNAINGNDFSSVPKNSTYSTLIIPNTNYSIDNITVTMGGVDISSSCVNNENINITQVTGDINITASTTKIDSTVYTNPSFSVKDFKITLSENGYTETFNASNGVDPYHFESKKEVVGDDMSYYIALGSIDTGSKFRVNGLYPYNGGYMEDKAKRDDKYIDYTLLVDYHIPIWTYTNWNFSYGIKNIGIEDEILQKAIYSHNAILPAFNVYVDNTSTNTIIQDSYSDNWYGQNTFMEDHFEIKINESLCYTDFGGNYGDSTVISNKWLSIAVHEIGHTVGFMDNPDHMPSLYNYNRQLDTCRYIQAPDLYTLKYLYIKTYGIDISKSQEEITAQATKLGLTNKVNDMPIKAYSSRPSYQICFDYPYYDKSELEDKSDVIVEGKLNFKEVRNINIGKDLNLEYNIYTISTNNIIKGALTNMELKIHVSEQLDIQSNENYRLYLKQYDNVPCSLINPNQGIEKI